MISTMQISKSKTVDFPISSCSQIHIRVTFINKKTTFCMKNNNKYYFFNKNDKKYFIEFLFFNVIF